MKIDKIKNRLKIESNLQLMMIFLVFSLAGTLILFEKKIIYNSLGFNELRFEIRTIIYVIMIIPLYQFNLILLGNILGQGKFFNNYSKFFFKRFLKRKK